MRVFDCHAHIFPDNIAAKTVALLGEEAGIEPSYDGTRAGLLASMQEAGIDAALNCPIATKAEQVDAINRWAAEQNAWPVVSLGTIHPDYPDVPAALSEVRKKGLPGIKLHPEYQLFTLDDPRMDIVWDTCRELNLLVLLHPGADIAFKPPYKTDPVTIGNLLDRWPGLTIVAAHMGSWEMWDDVATHLVGRELYFDTSFTLNCMPPERLVKLARAHGAERVLYGTDAPWRPQKQDLEEFLQLPWNDDERGRILWDNAAELLNLPGARRPRR